VRLRDLEAYFTKCRDRPVDMTSWEDTNANPGKTTVRGYRHVETLAEADGVWFLCPKCYVKNGGVLGTHMIAIGFADRDCLPGSYSQDRNGVDTRWNVSGADIDSLTLTPSIDLSQPEIVSCCGWHGFVGSNGVPPGEAA